MKPTLILLIALFICGFFSSCWREGAAIERTQHGDFNLELLFEKDSCKMYRFEDNGRNIYWADCRGKVNADLTTTNGKTTATHRRKSITTK